MSYLLLRFRYDHLLITSSEDPKDDNYFWFHYLFGRLLEQNSEFHQLWISTPKISADEPQLLRCAGLLKPATEHIDFIIKNKVSNVHKLSRRESIPDEIAGTVLDALYHSWRRALRLMRIHEHLLDFFMTLFALSSLALWGVVVSGGSFKTYAVLLLSIPLLSGYLVMINNRGHISAAPVENTAEHRENGSEVLSFLIFALVLIIFFVESNLITVSLLLVVLLMLMQQSKIRPKTLNHYSFVEGSPYVLCIAILIAVSYTLASHRPTADDALYLFFWALTSGSASASDNQSASVQRGEDAG